MKTLSDKLLSSNKKWQAAAPRLVRSMTNDAATYFKTFVWNKEGYDVQPTQVNGGRWKRRKKETKKTLGKKTLVSSGRLRKSLVANARGKMGVVSTSVPYGRFHMEGTDKMPMRKFMGESDILNKKFEKKILKTIQRVLEK